MNSLTAYALGQILNKRLKNRKIEGISQYPHLVTVSLSGKPNLFLHIFHSGFEPELVLSNSLIAKTKYSIPIFKQASGHIITNVKTLGTDRIILITIRSLTNWSSEKSYILRLDLMPSNSPLTLFNADTEGVVSTVSSLRSTAPISPYDTPPARPFSILSLPNEKPSELFTNGKVKDENQGKQQNTAAKLFNSISGLDPILARAIVTENGGNTDSIWNLIRKISGQINRGQFKWHVYQLHETRDVKTAIYPLSLPAGIEITRTESYPEAIKVHAEQTVFPLFMRKLKQKAAKPKRRELKHLKSLSANISKDLEKARRNEEFSLYGNLLSTHYDLLRKGMEEITLQNFSGTEKITIQLNKALGPHQNIQHYFKKAKKGKKGLKKITNRLKSVEKKSAQVSDSLEKLMLLENPDELLKLIPLQKGFSTQRNEKSQEGFRKFVLDKRHTVYIGKNAKDNDLLTHKFASRHDLWFHAKGVPGSHVILKGANSSTPPDILKTTASIAAYYSKSRHSKIVPVTYTEKKYVRKPRKSPPGTAAIERETVLFVIPSLPNSD